LCLVVEAQTTAACKTKGLEVIPSVVLQKVNSQGSIALLGLRPTAWPWYQVRQDGLLLSQTGAHESVDYTNAGIHVVDCGNNAVTYDGDWNCTMGPRCLVDPETGAVHNASTRSSIATANS
jgi:hypothetical protein